MRKPLFLFTLIAISLFFPSMAWAEKYYFYKEVGKKLPKGERSIILHLPQIKEKFGTDIGFSFHLPFEPRNSHNELSLTFDFGASSKSEGKYWFAVEDLALRDEEKAYPLQRIGPDPSLLTPLAEQNLGAEKVRILRQNEIINGRVKSKYEVEVKVGDVIGENFFFKTSPLPKSLYLDYKFRIRKEGGPEEVFEGSIPLELVSYNVSWWEKARW